jgi:enediyne polyketide synthase
LLRFVDVTRLHYPGVELIVDTELSLGRDPYLADHQVEGQFVWPGVMALEAMAQVASSLIGGTSPVSAKDIRFSSVIVIPEGGSVATRIAALRTGNCVETLITIGEDGFTNEHARATFEFTATGLDVVDCPPTTGLPECDAALIYGSLLFHGARFRRLSHFTGVSARRVMAALTSNTAARWFGGFEAQRLVLGDPTVRDALLHALQVAVPHRRVLPVSIERIVFGNSEATSTRAVERDATADSFVFDIISCDAAGSVVETLLGATFRAIGAIDPTPLFDHCPALAGPYLERLGREHLEAPSIEAALVQDVGISREQRRERALHALRFAGEISHRPDGKPEARENNACVSVSHQAGVTFVISGAVDLGCDLELLDPDTQDNVVRAWTLREVARKMASRDAGSRATTQETRDAGVLVSRHPDHISITTGPLVIGGTGYIAALGVRTAATSLPAHIQLPAREGLR